MLNFLFALCVVVGGFYAFLGITSLIIGFLRVVLSGLKIWFTGLLVSLNPFSSRVRSRTGIFSAMRIANTRMQQAARDASGVISGFASVIDGDTIVINGDLVRLMDLDAPEIGQRITRSPIDAGQRAKQAMVTLIGGQVVTAKLNGFDRYGRRLAKISIGSKDVALEMIQSGMAIADRQAPASYKDAERSARRNKTGLWALGGFAEPAAHRRSAHV